MTTLWLTRCASLTKYPMGGKQNDNDDEQTVQHGLDYIMLGTVSTMNKWFSDSQDILQDFV